ncbi:hypothetical protein ACFX15_039629 [Malus domestica]
MGAICCLEKPGLPLHQGSSQNDDQRGQTFSKVLKKEKVRQIKILEVQERSFYKRKFKCGLKRTVCLYKNQHSTRFQKSKRRAQNLKRPIQKIEEVLVFSKAGLAQKPRANLPFQTCPHLSHATSALDGAQKSKKPIQKSKRQAQKSKRHFAFLDMSAPITCKLSFAEIKGNLSKRRSQISKRRQSFSATSTPVMCTLSLAKITDNLSKISDEEKST